METTDKPLYMDPGRSVEGRVADLLGRMTLEEKVGQMNMPCLYLDALGGPYMGDGDKIIYENLENKRDACRQFTAGTYYQGIGPGGGFFTLANSILHEGARQQAEFFNELQKIAVEKTRLKIPLLQTEEGTHGLMCSGGTIFPEGLALGSTWNMDLIREVYATAAREARAVGVHQLYTLVIEPNRDPRLGRNMEGYSEDPFQCSRIAEAVVEGCQGEGIAAMDKVVAGLCHYPGQSEPVSGLERGEMEISERKLRTVFLPPWEAGIGKRGALGVMATYPSIDGVPVHASEKILTGILRDELGFEGLVLGEGSGLSTILHLNVASDQQEVGELALRAGVDVGISYEESYMGTMVENVRQGRVPLELIDRAVERILTLKFALGLFEHPYMDPDHAAAVSHTAEARALALQAAREGTVLLKNSSGLLPLDRNRIKSIAVIGPNADNGRNQLGDYTSTTILQDIVTILEGIRNKVRPGTEVKYVKGCNILDDGFDEIQQAAEASAGADVAVVVVGENERFAVDSLGRDIGTDGEGRDVASLDLTGRQDELVKRVVATGTPVIVVLVNGRPLSTRWIAENVQALVETWICGEEGGNAVAEILFGDYNPSGRLPVTVPRHVGQLPVYYNYSPSKAGHIASDGYVDMDAGPLFEFGYGISYTSFGYANLVIEPQRIGPGGNVRVSVDVTNTGDREGAEVVQLYLNDVKSSVVTPVKELKGFSKVRLGPGETKTVTLTLTPYDLSLIDVDLDRVVEPGRFEVMVGSSSRDIRLTGVFDVMEQ